MKIMTEAICWAEARVWPGFTSRQNFAPIDWKQHDSDATTQPMTSPAHLTYTTNHFTCSFVIHNQWAAVTQPNTPHLLIRHTQPMTSPAHLTYTTNDFTCSFVIHNQWLHLLICHTQPITSSAHSTNTQPMISIFIRHTQPNYRDKLCMLTADAVLLDNTTQKQYK